MVNYALDVKLTLTEQEILHILGESELMCKQLPHRLCGALPQMADKGLIEIYKKNISPVRNTSAKFIKKI